MVVMVRHIEELYPDFFPILFFLLLIVVCSKSKGKGVRPHTKEEEIFSLPKREIFFFFFFFFFVFVFFFFSRTLRL